MTKLKINTNSAFQTKLESYPNSIRGKMEYLRELVIETALEINEVTELEETLKWGEPSFLTKHGSTLRMDWKSKTPDQYAMYFKCTSRLVETFRKVFGDQFRYEKNRAIVFQLDQDVPAKYLKKCIKATLVYHLVKNDKSLGLDIKT